MFYPHHGINTPKWGQSASRHRWLLVLCASIFLVFCYASIDGLTGSTVYAGMERADALPTICEAGQDGEIKFCPQIGILPDSVATSIAWGDYDDDGDLDLAVGHGIPYSDPDLVKRDGNRGIYRDKIYRNHEGEFKLHLTLPITDSTRDIAWVDFDNDNDLDLVTANDDYIRIYENQSEIINKKPITISSPITGEPLDAQSMDWADYDGDGDLDLAVGNGIIVLNYQTQAPMSFRGKPDYIYKNLWDEEARFESVPIPGGSLPTTSIAWGDYTGDQKPDLVIGNGGIGRTKLYSNTANSNNDEILNFHQDIPGLFSTQSIAWGDYDNDGDLDLALGNLDLDRIVSPSLENLIKNNMGMTETVDGKNYIFENLLNESGKVGFKALPWSPYNAATTSVAWADYNGDGYLDLAVGNFTLLNTGDLEAVNSLYLYKDEEQPFSSKPDWETEVYDNDATMHIAWADYDNDSDLDLTTVNIDLDIGQPIKIYRNDHTSLSSQGQIIAENEEWSLQAVWGDYDGDGDLDVAVANRNQMPESLADGFSPNASVRVYQNMLIPSGTLTFTRQAIPDLTLTITDSVVSVAWGDYDVDGDLDLVIGSGDMVTVSIDGKIYPDFTGGENRVFQNLLKDPEQSGFKEVWNSSEGLTDISDVCSHAQTLCTQTDATTSVVWGDYDGDGDLDLAVANGILAARPNQIYRNDGVINGRLSLTHVWSSDETPSMAMAWGDYDQDGDLDLAVANRLHPNQIYQNQGQTEDGFPLFELVWESDEKDDSLSVKWGDVTGDGYLDLVFGNRKNNRIYYNQSKIPADEFSEEATTGEKSDCERLNQTLFACTAQWTSIDSEVTMDVALGDYDDDGDLDLVAANGGLDPVTALHTANHLYRNDDGVLSRLATWVFGQSRDSGSEDSQSSASVDWGDVDLDGTLDLLVSTLDGPNVIYTNIRQTETISPSLPIIRVGNPGKIAANGYASAKILSDSPIAIPFTLTHPMSMTVRKIQAWYSLDGGGHWQPAEPITLTQTTDLETSPTGIGYTFEWDVHKSGVMGQSDNVVVRIDALPAIKPRENDVLGDYLYGSSSDTTLPFRVRGTQVRVVDVNAGPLSKALVYGISNQTNFNEEPLGGLVNPFKTSQLGYLQGRETLSDTALLFALAPITVTQKYTLYYTGKLTIEADADITPITQSGIMTVPVSSENPLYIFDLTVSLEWDARKDRLYLQQLSSDLRRTSEILYDATNGQAALGNITIYHAKNYWHDADIRIYTTNRLRPHAAIGGITDGIKIKPFTISATETITTAYTGGQVHMPVEWNRYGDVTGSQNEDWPRTLAHELGHYLFYLLDSYFYLDDEGLPIAVQNCDGLMSNPYIEEFTEFHPSGSWDEQCVNTYAYQELRLSEWAVMKLFYEGLQPPPPDTTYEKLETGPNTLPIAVTNVHFAELQGQPSTTLESPKFYLVEHDLTESDNEKRYIASLSARVYLFQDGSILDLGRPRQDEIRAWGAKIDNDDRICVYDPPATGCLDVGNGGISRITMKPQKDWSPDILISPSAPNTLTIGVKQVDQGITLAAQIYSSYPITPSAQPPSITLQFDEQNGRYTGTLPLMRQGYLRIWEPANPDREIVTDFELSGAPLFTVYDDITLELDNTIITDTNGISRTISGTLLFNGDNLRIEGDVATVLQDGVTVTSRDGITEVLEAETTINISGTHATFGDGPTVILGGGTTVILGGGTTVILGGGTTVILGGGTTVILGGGTTVILGGGTTVILGGGTTDLLADGYAPILSSDGQMMLYVDPLDFGPDAFYLVQTVSSLPKTDSRMTAVGQGYRVTASPNAPPVAGKECHETNETNEHNENHKCNAISFRYLGREVRPGEEAFLRIYYHNGEDWEALETTLDMEQNHATAKARGEGVYALFSSIEVYLKPHILSVWDQFGYPINDSRLIKDALESIDGQYIRVVWYDAFDEQDPFKTYDPLAPAYANDLKKLRFGESYWIHLSEPITLSMKSASSTRPFTSMSDIESPTDLSVSGIAIPPATYYGAVNASDNMIPTEDMAVTAYIDGVVCGQGKTLLDDDRQVVYTIDVFADLSRAGCGEKGKEVYFCLDDVDTDDVYAVDVDEVATTGRWDNAQTQNLSLTLRQEQCRFPSDDTTAK